jgi:PAS domain S-box-containing protein
MTSPKIRFPRSIQGKLILLIFTLVIPNILILVYMHYDRFLARRAEELQANLELARAVSKNYETFIRDILLDELLIGTALTSSQPLSTEDQDRILAKALTMRPTVRYLFWANPAGRVLAATDSESIGIDLTDRPDIREILAGRDIVVSDLTLAQHPTFMIGRSIRNEAGGLIGMVIAGIAPDELKGVLGIQRSSDASVSILDSKGMLVYRYPETNYTLEQRNWLAQVPALEDALKFKEMVAKVTSVSTEKPQLAAFVPISSIGWVATASRAEGVVMEAAIYTLLPPAGLRLIIAITAFGTALVFSRKISTSIGVLRDHALALGRGERRTPVAMSGTLELDDLAGALNKMTEDLQSRQRERERAEKALHESEARLRQIIDLVPHMIFVKDSDGKYLLVNQAVAECYNTSTKALIGKNHGEFHPDEDELFNMLQDDHEVMSKGETKLIPEESFTDAQGNVRFLQTIKVPFHTSGDQTRAVLGVAVDITERKQAEKALMESERRLAQIIDFLPDATLVIDKDAKVIAWNHAMNAMTGIRARDMIGKAEYEYSLPFYDVRRPILIDLALHRNPEIEEKYTIIQRLGDTLFGEAFTPNLPPGNVHLSATASVLRDSSGEIIAAIECIRDNTERKALEERLQRAEKMEALGTLAAGVAHDLNNVLGVVIGFSELLSWDLPEASTERSRAMEILKSGERAAAIVQDLLTLARRGVPSRKVLNLNDIVRNFLHSPELAKLCSYHPGALIKTDLEADLLNVSGSEVHLTKSLTNLVSNAAEAMPEGGVITIRTSSRYLDKALLRYEEVRAGDYVVLSVTDNGGGITVADLKRIFEPFYTKKVMGRSGTGLGLAVVWGTVRDHMGYINVESKRGQTVFTLYFPVTREEITREQAASPIAEYTGRGESILVVDDVKEQRDLAAAMLTKPNYSVATVSSGEEAVEYLAQHTVNLIILDMIMDPGMDGLDTYAKILQIRPRQKAIIVSGFSETERVNMAQELGAGSYVRKPYVLEKLGLAVKKELHRSA